MDKFVPPWFLRNGHVQTVLTSIYRPKAVLASTVVHQVPLQNGHAMLIHENSPVGMHDERPAVLLLHGLGSSHDGTYMTKVAERLLHQGHRVFRVDLPGAGNSYQYSDLPPHGACYMEVWNGLRWLRDTLDIQRWQLVGVSLGGNIVLKLLAELSDKIDTGDGQGELTIERAIAVAPPIDLAGCCRNMESGLNRIYANYFLRVLKRQTHQRARRWPRWQERLATASFASIRQFDETITAPLAGFENAAAYYAAGSSYRQLPSIRVPTDVLVDVHDPVVPKEQFQDAVWSNTTQLHWTRFGGHVGYLMRPTKKESRTNEPKLRRWADEWILAKLSS